MVLKSSTTTKELEDKVKATYLELLNVRFKENPEALIQEKRGEYECCIGEVREKLPKIYQLQHRLLESEDIFKRNMQFVPEDSIRFYVELAKLSAMLSSWARFQSLKRKLNSEIVIRRNIASSLSGLQENLLYEKEFFEGLLNDEKTSEELGPKMDGLLEQIKEVSSMYRRLTEVAERNLAFSLRRYNLFFGKGEKNDT